MDKIYRSIKSIRGIVGLGVLTLLLVTTIIPVVAAEKFPAPNQKASRLLIKGKMAYESGKFSKATEYWSSAENKFELRGDRPHQALSLNYLALANQELGQWELAERYLDQSLQLLDSASNPQILARVLNTKGSLQLSQGKAPEALASWSQAEKIYRQTDDRMGIIDNQLNQAQALRQLKLYQRSQKILEQLQTKLDRESDPRLRVMGLLSLGKVLQVAGDLEQSEGVLQESLALAQELKLPQQANSILFSLGNTERSLKNYEEAIAYYEQAIARSPDPLMQVEAQLNQFDLLSQLEKLPTAEELIPQIQFDLSRLSPSRHSIYAKADLAKNIIDLNQSNRFEQYLPYSKKLLNKTIIEARKINDLRAESYALGTLGHLAEQKRQFDTAKKHTEEALALAIETNSSDIIYQWQWQLGRILQQQGDVSGAIAAESAAVDSLAKIRSDLVATNFNAQYSFPESVEPVYRDLVKLLVSTDPDQHNLSQAREVIESLQLAELENYFRESGIDAKPQQIDGIDAQAAVIYPVILSDRLSVIVSYPEQPLAYYEHRIDRAKAEQTIARLFESLNSVSSNKRRLKLSQQLYDWLIEPAEAELVANQIETLVFVLDGSLRNLPMAALYDGEQYLVEKYSVALTPGMQLLNPTASKERQLEAIVAGVSESNAGFDALPEVKTEVEEISQTVPSQSLLNQEFTSQNFRQQLTQTSSSLIHLATHGQFSSNPEQTFIVAWGDRLKVKDFDNILQARETSIDVEPIELLVLSGSQTAEGDERAALGINGIAVRSGARTTLATLWSVKDRSTTALMNQFYEQLTTADSVTKAQALRTAQIDLIHSDNYNHPYYWAPFILVGNWL